MATENILRILNVLVVTEDVLEVIFTSPSVPLGGYRHP